MFLSSSLVSYAKRGINNPTRHRMDVKPHYSWRSLFKYSFVAVLSLLLLIYALPSHGPTPNGQVLVTRDDFRANVVGNLTKRQAATYGSAITKGAKLHCLMGMSQGDAQKANKDVSLESTLHNYGPEEYEGWTYGEDKAPFYKNYLDSAFSGLGLSEEPRNQFWANTWEGRIWADAYDGVGEESKGVVSSAHIQSNL